MTQSLENLHFKFQNFGDSVLQKMNLLREENRFCDVTIQINKMKFHGHKVVFAACSPFLRDQFLLSDSKEVSVSTFQNPEVGSRLLLSCYTGFLEFPAKELVNYLTAASFLQLSHVVERCAQAVSQYLTPKLQENNAKSSMEASDGPMKDMAAEEKREDRPFQLGKSVAIKEDTGRTSEESECDAESGDTSHTSVVEVKPQVMEDFDDKEPEPEISLTLINSAVEFTRSYLQACANTGAAEPEVLNGESYLVAANEIESQGIGHVKNCGLEKGSPSVPSNGTKTASGAKYLPRSHLRAHETVLQRPYHCPRCSKVYLHLGNYITHIKEHKLYMCLRCGKMFSQKSNLTRHIRVHTGFKPYQCLVCKKSFTQKATLLDHMNLHSGVKPHKCNYCEVHFAHKPGLRRHLKEVHGKSSLENSNEDPQIEEITVD
uniref:Zinc finger and BTB domain containing 26 n=1 Tax=Latimeria chalumnae TaxID=7897 RepID=H3A5Y7_LATCH